MLAVDCSDPLGGYGLFDSAKAAIAAVREWDNVNRWQPIETAPAYEAIMTIHKDDLHPQSAALIPGEGGGESYWSRQIEGPEETPHSAGWNEPLYRPPTHWMPLLEGPRYE